MPVNCASDQAVVNVKFIGGQLIFDSAKTMTIWTDTVAGTAGKFKVEAMNSSKAITQLGLAALTADTDGTHMTGTKLTAVSADSVAKKEFDSATKVDIAPGETIDLGANHWSQDR